MNMFSKQYCIAIRYLRKNYFYFSFAPVLKILGNAFQKIDLVKAGVEKTQPIK